MCLMLPDILAVDPFRIHNIHFFYQTKIGYNIDISLSWHLWC